MMRSRGIEVLFNHYFNFIAEKWTFTSDCVVPYKPQSLSGLPLHKSWKMALNSFTVLSISLRNLKTRYLSSMALPQ